MADLGALRAALAANLATITGLQENAYLLTNPTPPAAEIEPGPTEYHKAMGNGLNRKRFIVRAFVGFSSDIGAQKKLDTLLADSGATSVKAALESDCTLGGLADDLIVVKNNGYMVFLREMQGASGRGSAGGPMLGSEWTVDVLVEGT